MARLVSMLAFFVAAFCLVIMSPDRIVAKERCTRLQAGETLSHAALRLTLKASQWRQADKIRNGKRRYSLKQARMLPVNTEVCFPTHLIKERSSEEKPEQIQITVTPETSKEASKSTKEKTSQNTHSALPGPDGNMISERYLIMLLMLVIVGILGIFVWKEWFYIVRFRPSNRKKLRLVADAIIANFKEADHPLFYSYAIDHWHLRIRCLSKRDPESAAQLITDIHKVIGWPQFRSLGFRLTFAPLVFKERLRAPGPDHTIFYLEFLAIHAWKPRLLSIEEHAKIKSMLGQEAARFVREFIQPHSTSSLPKPMIAETELIPEKREAIVKIKPAEKRTYPDLQNHNSNVKAATKKIMQDFFSTKRFVLVGDPMQKGEWVVFRFVLTDQYDEFEVTGDPAPPHHDKEQGKDQGKGADDDTSEQTQKEVA